MCVGWKVLLDGGSPASLGNEKTPGKEKKGGLRTERWIFKDDHLLLATPPLWDPDPSHMRLLRKKGMGVLGTLQGSTVDPRGLLSCLEVSGAHSIILIHSNPSSYLLPSEWGLLFLSYR